MLKVRTCISAFSTMSNCPDAKEEANRFKVVKDAYQVSEPYSRAQTRKGDQTDSKSQTIHLRFHNNFQVPKCETNKQTDLNDQKTIRRLSAQFGRAQLRKRDQP